MERLLQFLGDKDYYRIFHFNFAHVGEAHLFFYSIMVKKKRKKELDCFSCYHTFLKNPVIIHKNTSVSAVYSIALLIVSNQLKLHWAKKVYVKMNRWAQFCNNWCIKVQWVTENYFYKHNITMNIFNVEENSFHDSTVMSY